MAGIVSLLAIYSFIPKKEKPVVTVEEKTIAVLPGAKPKKDDVEKPKPKTDAAKNVSQQRLISTVHIVKDKDADSLKDFKPNVAIGSTDLKGDTTDIGIIPIVPSPGDGGGKDTTFGYTEARF